MTKKIKIEGTKFDQNKPKLALIPPEAIIEVGKVFTFGATKYEENNWRKGFKWTRLISAALRHIMAFCMGEDMDPESGLNHLAHASACLFMLLALFSRKELDDRYKSKE